MKKIRKDAKFPGMIRSLLQAFTPNVRFSEKDLYDFIRRTHMSPSAVAFVLQKAQIITAVADDAEGRHYERTPLGFDTAVAQYRKVNASRKIKARRKTAPEAVRATEQLYAMAERLENDATFLRRLAERLAPVEEALSPTDGRK